MNHKLINPFEITCEKAAAERGAAISRRLEMGTIVLAESTTRLHHPIGLLLGSSISLEMGFEAGYNFDEKSKTVMCLIKLHCKGIIDSSAIESIPKGSDAFTVIAGYALETTLGEDFEVPEERDNHLHDFSTINAPMMIWPLWREFLQSTTGRMGLVPIVAPFLRVELQKSTTAEP